MKIFYLFKALIKFSVTSFLPFVFKIFSYYVNHSYAAVFYSTTLLIPVRILLNVFALFSLF